MLSRFLGLSLACVGAANAWAASNCDRACLKDALDRYLAAVLEHDPSAAGLARNFRYTENADVVKPGDGIWKTATALGKVQRRYFDPVNGQAAYFGLIEEGSASGVAMLRIRVADRKVTEGELIIGRKVDGTFDADGLIAKPPPAETAASGPRASRQALLAAARSYFDGVEHHDGSLVIAHKGCYRVENGMLLTGRPIPGAQPSEPGGPVPVTDCATLGMFKATIAAVVHRRFPVVDEEAGVVLGMGIFNRPPGARRNDGSPFPRNLLSEFFMIEDGRIRGIYAAMHYMVPDNPNAPGWK
jgi:hypothetical protein